MLSVLLEKTFYLSLEPHSIASRNYNESFENSRDEVTKTAMIEFARKKSNLVNYVTIGITSTMKIVYISVCKSVDFLPVPNGTSINTQSPCDRSKKNYYGNLILPRVYTLV